MWNEKLRIFFDGLKAFLKKTLKWYLLAVVVGLLAFWGYRVYASWKALPLSLWHTTTLDEMTADEIDAADWAEYLRREEQLFADLKASVTDRLPASAQNAGNRYYEGSPLYPAHFAKNWNRSYALVPAGEPTGVAVLLHGLTDSPYSLRHVAELYRDRGYVALGIRLPGHGTIPAELAHIGWESWMAAANLSMREALRLVPQAGVELPLHIVGYSNGAALAMKYALNALEDESLVRPHRLVFFSPMIGITRYARYVGLAAIPALLPRFAKTAWLSILPEYNPFKYNSFPVNGPRQSYRLTKDLQAQIQRLSDADALIGLPPVISFQSLMDDTVSTAAIFYYLYEHLPENGSEIVIFDINRATDLSPFIKPASDVALRDVLPPLPLQYTLSVVANDVKLGRPLSSACVRVILPGGAAPERRALELAYPPDVFSLSHVAVPFPMDDALYGLDAAQEVRPEFGIRLGTIRARGEIGMLSVRMESLFRITSNPFFPYVRERLGEMIADPMPSAEARPHKKREASPGLLDRELERMMLEGDEDSSPVTP